MPKDRRTFGEHPSPDAAFGDTMNPFDAPKYVVLRQIAEALGVPIERFFTPKSSSEGPDGVAEFLTLWLRIRTTAGRQRALDHLRTIIEDEGRD